MSDCPSHAVPKDHGFGKNVRGVQAANAERNHSIERCRGANVDETDDAGNDRHDHDGIHWNRGTRLQLPTVSISPARAQDVVLTLLICRQKGRPRSRPNAKTMRDAVARKAIAAQMSMMMIMTIMTEAPDLEPVAS